MSIFNDTNNSINQILEILKNYRTEGKVKDSFLQDGFDNSHTLPDDSSFHLQQTNRLKETSDIKFRLHSSLQNIPKHKEPSSTIRPRQFMQTQENIFSRLYEEDKALRQRREKLFQNGRRRNQAKQSKQCTFSPNVKFKTEKCLNQQKIQSFYKKNMDWQLRVNKQIKIKQCQKINQGINQLTFAPKIVDYLKTQNSFKKKQKTNKQNSQTVIDKKGVEQFLQRQQKAKKGIETLEFRKKNAYSQIWNMKKCQFSYLH